MRVEVVEPPSPPGWLLVVLLSLTVTVPVSAQVSSSDGAVSTSGGIDGFGELAWGVDSATIVRTMGAPDTVRAIESLGARAIVYAEHEWGATPGSLGFLVHPDHGLVRAQFLVEYGAGESCLDLYQRLRSAVGNSLPSVSARESMYNEADDLPFCTAFQLGEAGARALWRDPRSSARAWISLDLRAGVVRVSFEGPGYAEIASAGDG